MHAQPRHIPPQALAADAADKMEQHRITTLLVCEGEDMKLVGTLHIGDLMRAKVI